MKNKENKMIYYATLAWEDPVIERMVSKTIRRDTYKDLVDDIKELLKRYQPRDAELETCAIEENLGDGISSWEDITEKVQKELN
mgnify:CR=1 FL=1